MENIEKDKVKKMMDSIENNPILEQKLAQSKKIYDKIAHKIDILLKKDDK